MGRLTTGGLAPIGFADGGNELLEAVVAPRPRPASSSRSNSATRCSARARKAPSFFSRRTRSRLRANNPANRRRSI